MELLFGILTCLVVNVPSVNMFSHGRGRTRTLSPTGNVRLSFLGKQMQQIPSLLDLTRKHQPSERTIRHTARKRFFSFNPVTFGKHSEEDPFEISVKRFFGIPFYGQTDSHHHKKTDSDMSFKSALIGKGSKAKHVTPYVDHFSGVKAWALPFYKSKDEQDNPTEEELADNTASTTNTQNNDTEHSTNIEKEPSSVFSEAAFQSVDTPDLETPAQRRKETLKTMESLIKESFPGVKERSHWMDTDNFVVSSDSSDLLNKFDNPLETSNTHLNPHKTSNANLKHLKTSHTGLEILKQSNLESRRKPDDFLPSGKLSEIFVQPINTANQVGEQISEPSPFHHWSGNSSFNGNDGGFSAPMALTNPETFGEFFTDDIGFGAFPDTSAPGWNTYEVPGESSDGFGAIPDTWPTTGFSTDGNDCLGVKSTPCLVDSDCGCEGFYFCVTETCTSIEDLSSGYDYVDYDNVLPIEGHIDSPIVGPELGFPEEGEWLNGPVEFPKTDESTDYGSQYTSV